ncbi:hypothetical protein IH601_10105 [Candidatus Bipolaricaulota bacterium]|jgi:hypothetical protein|nr:hypothetical protein [Candidatus Bipolaricaulota bacterium]TFH10693.1 MAG: hypothetical protein E4H08_03160 [Candidatus Atribacteria bacterium]
MTDDVLRDERLVIWDTLIRGEPVLRADVSSLILGLTHDAPDAERAGSVLLLAAIRYLETTRPSSRWRLRAALWYWFSQTGTRNRSGGFRLTQLKRCGLADLAGLCLTWPEVMKVMGRNPNDYSALARIQIDLTALFGEEWKNLFGTSPPKAMNTLE